jgi:prepilin-type N-terminal cleavage/methylation domain-containing protein
MESKVVKTKTRTSGAESCRGFTLLELLLVCVLLVLAAGLTASFLSGSDQKEFSVNLRQISAQLINSRRQAIITGAEKAVKLTTAAAATESPDDSLVSPPSWLNENMTLRYAASLDETLEESSEIVVDFFPMGNSTGGLIELSDSERNTYLYVFPLTGKLIVESELGELEARVEEGRL